jgi:Fe-S-cluster containining protein
VGRTVSESSSRRPWYASGLRFECVPDCGRCCINHGPYTYVYLEGTDAARLADHLGMTLSEFLGTHAEWDDGLLALRSSADACTFLDGTRCSVHPARPVQCRTFPFWREHLRSPRRWRRVASLCPGVDRGDRHDADRIAEWMKSRKLG